MEHKHLKIDRQRRLRPDGRKAALLDVVFADGAAYSREVDVAAGASAAADVLDKLRARHEKKAAWLAEHAQSVRNRTHVVAGRRYRVIDCTVRELKSDSVEARDTVRLYVDVRLVAGQRESRVPGFPIDRLCASVAQLPTTIEIEEMIRAALEADAENEVDFAAFDSSVMTEIASRARARAGGKGRE